ncbi:MAG: fasciclin domain-containing protein [Sphingopyxis sp.]
MRYIKKAIEADDMRPLLILSALPLSFLMLNACVDGAVGDTASASAPTIQGVEPATIAAALSGLPEFSRLRAMMSRGGLAASLANREATITLLAPRDSAFAQLPNETRAALVAAPPAALQSMLRALMIPRIIHAEELRTRIIDGGGSLTITSTAGTPLNFRLTGEQFIVTGPSGASANMGSANLATGNGAVYIIDHWIGPTG